MPDHAMPTRLDLRRGQARAARLARDAYAGRLIEGAAAIDNLARGLRYLLSERGRTDKLDEIIAYLIDEWRNHQHTMERNLDEAGACSDERLDLSELEAMLFPVAAPAVRRASEPDATTSSNRIRRAPGVEHDLAGDS